MSNAGPSGTGHKRNNDEALHSPTSPKRTRGDAKREDDDDDMGFDYMPPGNDLEYRFPVPSDPIVFEDLAKKVNTIPERNRAKYAKALKFFLRPPLHIFDFSPAKLTVDKANQRKLLKLQKSRLIIEIYYFVLGQDERNEDFDVNKNLRADSPMDLLLGEYKNSTTYVQEFADENKPEAQLFVMYQDYLRGIRNADDDWTDGLSDKDALRDYTFENMLSVPFFYKCKPETIKFSTWSEIIRAMASTNPPDVCFTKAKDGNRRLSHLGLSRCYPHIYSRTSGLSGPFDATDFKKQAQGILLNTNLLNFLTVYAPISRIQKVAGWRMHIPSKYNEKGEKQASSVSYLRPELNQKSGIMNAPDQQWFLNGNAMNEGAPLF